jgi:hypothetical protein
MNIIDMAISGAAGAAGAAAGPAASPAWANDASWFANEPYTAVEPMPASIKRLDRKLFMPRPLFIVLIPTDGRRKSPFA